MNNPLSTRLAVAVILIAISAVARVEAAGEKAADRPNLVLLVADDLGWADVSFHGGEIPTPAIDRIAQEGVKLERFYVCPVCSPTRAGLMTGRWPLRVGIMRTVIPPWRRWGLPPGEKTLAELVADAGYRRRAIIGKWHLGHCDRKYHPLNQGFTYFYGHYNGAIDYWTHQREGEVDWHRNFDTVHEEGYSTDLIGAEAVRFIHESPAGEPFFLYVPFNAPHSPFQAHDEDVRRFAHIENKRRRIYAAMVVALDRAVGTILDALDRRGLADETFVLFFSDNGGVERVADNGPLRAGKATVYEGGIRVAAAARWPDGGIRGGGSIDGPIGYIDVYPTVKRIVGLADAADPNPLDGVDVLDVLRGKAEPPSRDWLSYLSMTDPVEHISLIAGRHKLNAHGPSVLEETPQGDRELELFDLEQDPYEARNLIDDHPELVRPMLQKLRALRRQKIDGVGPYGEGREGFQAPKDWVIGP
ncbi:MAG TPA: arylsulfatase [Thermoguttaceae bacterium]|nr:arylsulfatase [Thermoguttaceae bacterium]